MRATRALATTAAATLAVVACQVVAGIEPVEKVDAAALDGASPDASGDGGADAGVDPCHHVLPPPEPDKDDDRDTELPPFYLALRTLDVIAKDGDSYRGFDLDGVCTCDKRPGTASNGASSCAPKLKDCDFDGGIDNRGATLFEQFSPTGFSPSDSANDGIAAGRRGLLLYVKGYNGKPNDRQVSVGVMITYGIVDGSGCGTSSGRDRSPPGWCGNDLWTYPLEYVKPTTKEPLFQGNGYVNDGTLVFRSELPITMFFGGATLTFGSPITAGVLAKNGAGLWTYDALLSGRIPVTELLGATGNFSAPDDESSMLCNSPFFATVKKTLCDAVDINRTSVLDFEEGACDAISTALGFTAEQASVGNELTEAQDDSPCARDNVPADLYTCP
ncbi:MAG: hypothetical protein KIS78_24560 [Labilithrix sp.]|nr:hypothetical protein [Labilithrix sp.]MCW5835596.1 hypothetical protein [Labilithrix sp.]